MSASLLRQLLCRRIVLRQLYMLIVGGGTTLLLLRVVAVHQGALHGGGPAGARFITADLVQPPGRAAGTAGRRAESPPPPPPPTQQRVWDSRRPWLSFPLAVVGEERAQLSRTLRVTLATQASLDRLDRVAELAARWAGPLSVAVFAPDVEHALVTAFVAYLRRCSDAVRRRVTFSLLVPAARPARSLPGGGGLVSMPCGAPRETLAALLRRRPRSVMAWREKMAYPQNVLRNLARKTSQTEFVWLVDADVVPVGGAATALDEFLRSDEASTCARCVFVVPTYEVDAKEAFPESAAQLLKLVRRKKARPFHEKVFIHNQFATNHSRWEKHALEFNKTGIIHPVTNLEFFYEPFYVSRDDVPDHDERFVGYGFTRNTQTYETLSAGYRFVVLAPLFAVHWGLQERRTRPGWREQQNNANRRLFADFKKDVFARYGTDPLGILKAERDRGAAAAKRARLRGKYEAAARHAALRGRIGGAGGAAPGKPAS